MAQNLSNLPLGAKVKFGKHSVNTEAAQAIIWTIVAKNHSSTPAYPSNSVTLLTEKIIDLRAFDGKEPNNTYSDRQANGNNEYGYSNIDQWLNSSGNGGSWYKATHSSDEPPSYLRVTRGTEYDTRPGFLYNFTESERNIILNTTIRTAVYNRETRDITRKVFLPSASEVGSNLDVADGAAWAGFNTRKPVLTAQCYNNTKSGAKPTAIANSWMWFTRTAHYVTSGNVYAIDKDGISSNTPANSGDAGIRPALNLPSTLSISDSTDSDGCYTVVWNSSPPAPTPLTVPAIYGGKAFNVSWGKVTDPDGHAVTYQLESSVNGGAYTTIYSGTNLSYNTSVPFGTTSVQFRVKAVDSLGASSGYTSSTSKTVINNNAPVISGSNGNLGTKSSGFTQTYTITDANSNTVTVTEEIDGVRVRSYVATLGATNTFSVTGNTFVTLANGNHTLTITATDGIDTSVRTYTFTKSVNSFTIANAAAIVSSTRPTRIKINVTKNIPPEATFKVEVCNNAYDSVATWEDATSSVNGGLVHVFTNTTKTSTNWSVRIRVTVNRNGGSGECYVSSIGGNFE